MLDHFKDKKLPLGCGDAPFWQKPVTLDQLNEGQKVLIKIGFTPSQISLEELVSWKSLTNRQWKQGPQKEDLKVDISWKQCLVLVYEVLLAHLGIRSHAH